MLRGDGVNMSNVLPKRSAVRTTRVTGSIARSWRTAGVVETDGVSVGGATKCHSKCGRGSGR